MKAHLITVLVINHEDMPQDDVEHYIENARFVNPLVVSHKVAEIGEWDDAHPLNRRFEAEVARMESENLFVDT